MNVNEIRSVGELQNGDGSVCLAICLQYSNHPVYVSVPREEYELAGGISGLNEDRSKVVDFYFRYGIGRL